MRGIGIVGAAVTAAAVCAGALVAMPAHADGSRITVVEWHRLWDADPRYVRVELQALDAAGAAVPFSGTVGLQDRSVLFSHRSVEKHRSRPVARFRATLRAVTAPIVSRDGSAAVARIGVRALRPSDIGDSYTWSLTAAGDTAPYTETPPLRFVQIETADALDAKRFRGVSAGESIVPSTDVTAFEGLAQQWRCAERDLNWGRATCVVPAGSAGQAAGAGPSFTFTWTPPRKADGTTYARCLLLPELRLIGRKATRPAPPGGSGAPPSGASAGAPPGPPPADGAAAPMTVRGATPTDGVDPTVLPVQTGDVVPAPSELTTALDVPGDLSSYRVPVTRTPALAKAVWGKDLLTWTLGCYDSTRDELTTTSETTPLPDIAPTAPTRASAAEDDSVAGAIDVTATGARALGGAPLKGYRFTVSTRTGHVVRRVLVRADSGSADATISGLGDGMYTVGVQAVNRVGASAVLGAGTVVIGSGRKIT